MRSACKEVKTTTDVPTKVILVEHLWEKPKNLFKCVGVSRCVYLCNSYYTVSVTHCIELKLFSSNYTSSISVETSLL